MGEENHARRVGGLDEVSVQTRRRNPNSRLSHLPLSERGAIAQPPQSPDPGYQTHGAIARKRLTHHRSRRGFTRRAAFTQPANEENRRAAASCHCFLPPGRRHKLRSVPLPFMPSPVSTVEESSFHEETDPRPATHRSAWRAVRPGPPPGIPPNWVFTSVTVI
jgi:hypothetical protein